jgi:DNA polymerase III epsilon subunit-like protein
MVVGHNIEFDEEIIRWELARLWRKWDYQPIKTVCTMKSSTEFCKLQWRWFWFKSPKLNELYKQLFGDWFEWAHDAMQDVEATAKAFGELVKKWVIVLKESNVLRLF